jgi:hypothetical protein
MIQTVKPKSLIFKALIFGALLQVASLDIAFAKDSNTAQGANQSTKVELINWGSDEGIKRFNAATVKTDFFKLANHFESQNNKIYCGVASSVIVLNALRVRNGDNQSLKPKASSVLSDSDRKYISNVFSPFFDRYTQDNLFTTQAKTKSEILGKPIKQKNNEKEKRDIGLQLHQLEALLLSHDLKVVKKVADQSLSVEEFRKDIIQNLNTKDDYILVNYTRKALNQKGGGHISPLAAFDTASDSVLVMDVNSNKADWVWVSVDLLFEAMSTFDTIENRGYLLISEK